MLASASDLVGLGFSGFLTFDEILSARSAVPDGPGVYSVVAPDRVTPEFLNVSTAGRFKGRNPTVDRDTLSRKWVETSAILYFGKAAQGQTGRRGLRRRLVEYARFGCGDPVGHWGGRYIWQVSGYEQFRVAWMDLKCDPATSKRALMRAFHDEHGKLPFANLRF